MRTITFIVGIERFNAGVWTDVERRLAEAGVAVRLKLRTSSPPTSSS